jgi:hypothetical protein
MVSFIKKHKRTLILLFTGIILLAAGFVYVSLRAVNTLFETDKVTPTPTEYSQWVGLWLPDDVANFQAYGEGWQDWLVEARFELTASQFAEFLERNAFVQSEIYSVPESSYKLEWFASTKALEYYEIKSSPESSASTLAGFYPSVWVDKLHADKIIVYIRAFDT